MRKLVNYSGVILFFLLVVVAAVQSYQHFALRQRLGEIQEQSIQLRARNEDMQEEIERLHQPGYLELLARKYLGLVKPGETVYRIED